MSHINQTQLKRIRAQIKRRHHSLQKDVDIAKKLLVTTESDAITLNELLQQLDDHITIVTDSLKTYDNYSFELSEHSDDIDDAAFDDKIEHLADFSIDVRRWISRMSAYRRRLQIPPQQNINNNTGTSNASNPVDNSNGGSAAFAGIEKQLSRLLDHTFNNNNSNSDASTHSQAVPTVKHPKLELGKFDGNLLKFKEFWDTFEVAVDGNPRLQPVKQMNYLLFQVEGDAKAAISGLELTNDSYSVAVDLIKERFGNPQTLVSSLYSRLINLPITPNNTAKLRSLYDEFECILWSLASLHQVIDNQQFVSILTSKLPHKVVLALERSKSLGVDWTTDLIRRVLHAELCAREAAERCRGSSATRNGPNNPGSSKFTNRPNKSTGEALFVGSKKSAPNKRTITKRFIYCENEFHWSDECRKFPSAKSRRDKIKGRCYNCLGKSHSAKSCTFQKPCPYCSKTGHHRSLCDMKFGVGTKENAHVATESNSDVDSACHRSYITEALADKLNLKLKEGEIISVNTFGSTRHNDIATKTAIIALKTKTGNTLQISVNVVPHITGDVQRYPIKFGETAKLWQNLQMADNLPTQKEVSTIDILIGNDFYLDIISGEKIKVKDGLYLLGSYFGWILSGRIERSCSLKQNNLSMLAISHTNALMTQDNPLISRVDTHLPLKINFEDYWHLETIGITDPPDITDDDRAICTFENIIKFEDGRYQVCFPWKDEAPELATNFNLSFCRLKSVVEKRLSINIDLLAKYNEIIEDQLKKGVIERIDESVRDGPRVHYLPHHHVITEQKETTKVCIVYDASAKSKKGTLSLNECLLRGPVILSDLCGLLLRFRQEQIAMISHIEKAFLQVGLQKHDREVTRFFWLQDPTVPKVDKNVQIFRFCRVPFGAISSPFLFAATCVHHLKKNGSHCAMKICNNMYVDNVITVMDTVVNAKSFYTESKNIFNEANMNLREWASNFQELLDFIPEKDKAKIDNLKVLGIVWKPLTDTIIASPGSFDIHTKRDVLKAIASIFDPLGYFAPITIMGELFLQELWSQKLDWDDPIPNVKRQEWDNIAEELKQISSKLFPRFLSINKMDEFHLIYFCDASKWCYATTVYLLNKTDGKTNSRNLVFAKARLAPKKEITLPRLELMAAVIGVRSLRFVEEQSRLPISKLFSDSQCVLHWLCSTKNLERFVSNRLKEIKSCSNVSFRYVSTKDNPADLPTRGKQFLEINDFWFHGPSWLTYPEEQWPKYNMPDISEKTLEKIQDKEKQQCSVLFEAGLVVGEEPADVHPPLDPNLENFSSIIKVCRITAWCLHFIGPKPNSPLKTLTANEINKAKLLWEKYVQKVNFPDLNKGSNSPMIRQLSLFFDSQGLIRCTGRLKNAELKHDAIYPKLLPKKHRFTELSILECHYKLAHFGASQTVSELRDEYWVPHGRTVVKGILKHSQICRIWEGGCYKPPIMLDLPGARVVKSDPFSHVGIDYFGPLYIKGNKETNKCWVCLYTCMSTRTVHLELMRDMTTEQFLLGFRRFTSRRGKPIEVISDNAKQFRLSKGIVAEV